MMATLIEAVWKQAMRTFSKSAGHSFEDNFKVLKSLADRITSSDVNLDHRLLDKNIRSNGGSAQEPPVTYIEIYEDKNFTIGIFILRPGVKIPLHDHPGMHGILKVIAGSVRIQSYTLLEEMTSDCGLPGNLLSCKLAEKMPELQLSEGDKACILTPNIRNLHEVRSVNGSAAFVDILAPPYDTSDQGGRSCHYYMELPSPKNVAAADSPQQTNNHVRLIHTPSPPEFWCDAATYEGPELRCVQVGTTLSPGVFLYSMLATGEAIMKPDHSASYMLLLRCHKIEYICFSAHITSQIL